MIFTASRYTFTVSTMRETAAAEPRPYHHGDLSRALIDAARRLLESEGPSALSLRAVAREAGVSRLVTVDLAEATKLAGAA